MASTINATTSGVVTTGDTVASLALQTSGSNAVTVDSSQNVTLAKSLIISGSTSGNVTFTANAISGTQSYTLPPALPAVTGYALTSTTGGVMSWASSGGGGTPGGSSTQVQYNNGGTTFGGISGFTTDGTRVTASTTIGVGGATPSTSGSGVTFPATQSASTDVNTLDDYEEGTWTPSLGGTTTYGGQVGTYTKIGNLVEVNFSLNITSIGSGSTSQISGLPFTPGGASTLTGSVGYFDSVLSSTVGFFLRIDGGTAAIKIAGTTAAATSVTTSYGTFKNGTVFIGNALFYV